MAESGPLSHRFTEVYGLNAQCWDSDKGRKHNHPPLDLQAALNRAMNEWTARRDNVDVKMAIKFPEDAMASFHDVYSAIAAVTFAQDPGRCTLVDSDGICRYCRALDGGTELRAVAQDRIDALNTTTNLTHPIWPGVGSAETLIIPWLFAKHFVTLVIRTTSSRNVSKQLKSKPGWSITLCDSTNRPQPTFKGPKIEMALISHIEQMLRDLQWFGDEIDPEVRNPQGLKVQPTSKQIPKSTHCGTHAVLNAWVAALDQEPDVSFQPTPEFIKQATQVINLALAGYMDVDTILMFLRSWKYIKLKTWEGAVRPYDFDRTAPTGVEVNRVQKLYTERLKQHIFEDQLCDFKEVWKILPGAKSKTPKKIHKGPQITFPGGLAKLEMLSFEEIFTAIAAVTFTQDRNTFIDAEGVFMFSDLTVQTKAIFSQRYKARIKHLDSLAETKPDHWPMAGNGTRLIIPWQNYWSPNSFSTILIDKVFRGVNEKNGWSATLYSSLEVPADAENQLKATRKALRCMLNNLEWFSVSDIDIDGLEGNALQIGKAAPQMPDYEHSGIHSVLNAWALALGLKLDLTFRPTEEFLGQAADMINLALAGRMTAPTMFWFFRRWDYVKGEDASFNAKPPCGFKGETLPLGMAVDQSITGTEDCSQVQVAYIALLLQNIRDETLREVRRKFGRMVGLRSTSPDELA